MTSSLARTVSFPDATLPQRRLAVIGAGIAGVSCALQLARAGWRVTLIDKSRGWGGRMATRKTEFGGFDHGAQYFTVRDARFEQALAAHPGLLQPWSPETMRVLDPEALTLTPSPAPQTTHWVATPGMSALARELGKPLADGSLGADVVLGTRVARIERDTIQPQQWQLRCETGAAAEGAQQVLGGFDQVVLAIPQPQVLELLRASQLAPELQQAIAEVEVAPCWTLMLAFPQAMQPDWTSSARSGMPRAASITACAGSRARTASRAAAASSAGSCRRVPNGRPSIWRTMPSASAPSC